MSNTLLEEQANLIHSVGNGMLKQSIENLTNALSAFSCGATYFSFVCHLIPKSSGVLILRSSRFKLISVARELIQLGIGGVGFFFMRNSGIRTQNSRRYA